MRDFMAEFIQQPCVLVGNSVGSLVVLTVRCSGFRVLLFAAAEPGSACMSGHQVRRTGRQTRHGGPPCAHMHASAQVAAREPEGKVAGTVLVNCAGGLNNKAIVQDWRIQLAMPL